MTESLYLHGFNLLPQIGPRRLAKILRHFTTAENAWHSRTQDWANIGFENALIENIFAHKSKTNLEKEKDTLNKQQINLVTWQEEKYPKLLKEIHDPPVILYYKGNLPIADSLMIAIVGTRKITNYGKQVTSMLASALASAGAVIVSGLAFGIDAEAHKSTVENNGTTIAIIGGGVDDKSFYPKDHGLLGKRIIESGGCITSEYAPGTPPLKQNFINRNRIIAGISVATVIVECDLKSGALITARAALNENRQVFAVPGPITSPTSLGPNRLLQMGAKLVLEANDILDELNIAKPKNTTEKPKALPALSASEKIVLEYLSLNQSQPDEIIRQTSLSPSQTASAISMLEMKGLIKNLGAKQYTKTR